MLYWKKDLKVALVHDWLTEMRGGEKCLEILCEMFPNADIYTLFCNSKKISNIILNHNIYTSYLQRFPYLFDKYRYYLPLFPHAIQSFHLDQYDLVISSSHCVAKGVILSDNICHISYIHTPMRYMWDLFDQYFSNDSSNKFVAYVAKLMCPYFRYWDLNSNKNIYQILCNSKNIQEKIKNFYCKESNVIYPPVNLNKFTPLKSQINRKNYYLMVGAFAPNKNIPLAIQTFNRLGLSLKIIGTGQTENYCRSIACKNIQFLGNINNDLISKLYCEARAFVFPGEDDFGITPLEALASGIPVIAYAAGGALETVTQETGFFFNEPTVESLSNAIISMEQKWQGFSSRACLNRAKLFSRERYRKKMEVAIQFAYLEWSKKKNEL